MAMKAEAKMTTTAEHHLIQKWVEDRGGVPARVKGTEDAEGTGLLSIDFQDGDENDKLQEISWAEFFDIFERKRI